jgi:methyl-accepting chemotaxis protein-2 (aspartate sensor receptor)
VIDGIAIQANILALNAAVGPAPAGEQAHRFAVVASEARARARAAQGAGGQGDQDADRRQGERVEPGNAQAHQAGRAITASIEQVQAVGRLIGSISGAASDQRAGISQIDTAVAQLDQVTQQNAALVEQSAAPSHSLIDQATRRVEAVRVFRLEREAAPA